MKTKKMNADVNLDSFFDDISSSPLPSKGKHTVLLVSSEKIDEKKSDDGTTIAQKHLALTWQDVNDGSFIDARLYSAAVPYFMANLNRQLDGALMGMKLSGVLNYVVTHSVDIWVDWSSQYGVQVNYFER